MNQYAIAGLICLMGGLINGTTGFGALLIMVPLLLLFLDMPTAIPLGVLCCIALQAQGVIIYRAHIQKRYLTPLIVGSLPGVCIGGLYLSRLPEFWLRTVLGALFILYGLWNLFGKHAAPQRPPTAFWAYVAGFWSGALGAAFGINGPPAVIYVTRTGWDQAAIRGTLNCLLTLLFVIVTIMHYYQGLLTPQVWKFAMLCVPICFVSSRLGRRLTAGIRTDQYMRLIFILLLAMGGSLCVPAVKAIFT